MSEPTVLPGVGVGAGDGKILPTPTPAQSRISREQTMILAERLCVVTNHENTERQEKKGGGVQMKLKRH